MNVWFTQVAPVVRENVWMHVTKMNRKRMSDRGNVRRADILGRNSIFSCVARGAWANGLIHPSIN